MDPKKDLLTVLAYAGLSVLFAAICVAVWATGGHHFFVKHKLRIGAIMLTLAGVATTGCVTRTCYEPVQDDDDSMADETNVMALDGYLSGDTIQVDLSVDNTLTGTITNPEGQNFAFAVMSADLLIQAAAIESIDGAIDQEVETFEITLDPGLDSGQYALHLTDADESQVTVVDPRASYIIEVLGADAT